MANKNTRSYRNKVRAAGKAGEDFAVIERPSRSYPLAESRAKGMTTVSFPTARVKGDGVNSVNKRRNSCQRLYLNQSEAGVTQSLTAHEPFLKHEPMVFPNHRQYKNWEYRRVHAGQASA